MVVAMRDRWISIPCRVRLDIYLVVMEGKGEGEKSGGERGREERRERWELPL